MKNLIHNLIITFFLAINSIFAQNWQAQPLLFPAPSFGWQTSIPDEMTAFTWGHSFDGVDKVCLKTTNAGQTWEQIAFPFDATNTELTNIMALSKDIAFITYHSSASGEHLFKTINGGQLWTEQITGINTYINFAHFFTPQMGVTMGDPGTDNEFQIYTTDNGGTNWNKVDVASIPNAVAGEYGSPTSYATRGDKIIFNTTKGRIFYSANKGQNWTMWDKPATAGNINASEQPEMDDDGYVYQTYHSVSPQTFQVFRRKITDANWTDISTSNTNPTIPSLCAIPGTNTLILNLRVFQNSAVTYSTKVSYDKGLTWTTIPTDPASRQFRVEFLNATTGYATEGTSPTNNTSTNIYKYTGSPLTGLLDPKSIDVNLSISPNPTSDFINITLKSPKKSDFWLLLNDASGRLIAKKEFEKVEEIAHSFEVKGLAAGVYTVTVSSAEGLVSRQVVVQ
jgi:hypothetical protein